MLVAHTQIKILVVDDHGIVRDGLKLLIERQDHMQVVGTAATGDEAVRIATRLTPDVIVMDLMLPSLGGSDATEQILEILPYTRVVILSASRSPEHVFQALRAGAHGYVLKDSASAELIHAVQTVFDGHRYLSAPITSLVIDGLLSHRNSESLMERLSARERQVLHMTVGGASSAEIGKQLSLSRKTIDTYRSRLMGKLHVADRTQLIHFAIEHALTPIQ